MKKFKLVFVTCLLASFLAILFSKTTTVFAASEPVNLSTEQVIKEIFGDKRIKSTEYLYNLNNSPDFIYVDFENYGYAVLLRETSELLEFAPEGSLPYPDTVTKKYYGGPTNYLEKAAEQFIHIGTDETFYISKTEAENYSKVLLDVFSKSTVDKGNILEVVKPEDIPFERERSGNLGTGETDPTLDKEGIISGNLPGSSGTKYISNAQYFLENPRHGDNSTGTCGAVAAQLLLSYHNYYSDRRIIAPQQLNGVWNSATSNGNVFDPANYTTPDNDPNVCADPQCMTRDTLGSNGKNETDTGTFFNLLVNKIPASARTNQVRDGIENILNNRNNEIAGNINYTVKSHLPFLWIGPIGESGIKEEINAGRPVIILMQKNLGGWDHYIVAYGYQNIISPTNGKQYSGYITHFGHSDDTPNRTNVWVNSSWCFSYVSMQVNHTHNYNVDTGNNIGNDKRELRCNECGHRTVKDLYNVSGNTITSARYPLSGSITVPSTINGMTITTIGNSAFANQTQMTQITIPSSVTTVGVNAFSGCSNLSIYITGRTSVPSGWNKDWNPLDRPIYFNGNRHTHYDDGLEMTGNHYHGIKKVHHYEFRTYCTKCKFTFETYYDTQSCSGPPCMTPYSLPPFSELYRSDDHSHDNDLSNVFKSTMFIYNVPENEYQEKMFLR